MVYYVYAIYIDSTKNRLYQTFSNFIEAMKMQQEMVKGNQPGDNYFVEMIKANDDADAEEKLTQLRKDKGLPF